MKEKKELINLILLQHSRAHNLHHTFQFVVVLIGWFSNMNLYRINWLAFRVTVKTTSFDLHANIWKHTNREPNFEIVMFTEALSYFL